jgi:hypothetical protein
MSASEVLAHQWLQVYVSTIELWLAMMNVSLSRSFEWAFKPWFSSWLGQRFGRSAEPSDLERGVTAECQRCWFPAFNALKRSKRGDEAVPADAPCCSSIVSVFSLARVLWRTVWNESISHFSLDSRVSLLVKRKEDSHTLHLQLPLPFKVHAQERFETNQLLTFLLIGVWVFWWIKKKDSTTFNFQVTASV